MTHPLQLPRQNIAGVLFYILHNILLTTLKAITKTNSLLLLNKKTDTQYMLHDYNMIFLKCKVYLVLRKNTRNLKVKKTPHLAKAHVKTHKDFGIKSCVSVNTMKAP